MAYDLYGRPINFPPHQVPYGAPGAPNIPRFQPQPVAPSSVGWGSSFVNNPQTQYPSNQPSPYYRQPNAFNQPECRAVVAPSQNYGVPMAGQPPYPPPPVEGQPASATPFFGWVTPGASAAPSPYPNSSPYPGSSPYPSNPSPYPGNTQYPSNSPYPYPGGPTPQTHSQAFDPQQPGQFAYPAPGAGSNPIPDQFGGAPLPGAPQYPPPPSTLSPDSGQAQYPYPPNVSAPVAGPEQFQPQQYSSNPSAPLASPSPLSSPEEEQNPYQAGPAPDNYTFNPSAAHPVVGLMAHNSLRKKHGSPLMKLDPELNQAAHDCAVHYARTRVMDNSFETLNTGENFYLHEPVPGAAPLNLQNAVKKAVQAWYDERVTYNFENPGASTGFTARFTQLVWKETTELGIGAATVNGYTAVVAKYRPQGNIALEGNGFDKWTYYRENVQRSA